MRVFLASLLAIASIPLMSQNEVSFGGYVTITSSTDNGNPSDSISIVNGALIDMMRVYDATDIVPGDKLLDCLCNEYDVSSVTSATGMFFTLQVKSVNAQVETVKPCNGGAMYRLGTDSITTINPSVREPARNCLIEKGLRSAVVSSATFAPNVVDSVGEIRKLSLPEGTVIRTRGFYTPNDGADAEYLVRTDTLLGYVTDQRAIVTLANGLFAHLLPRGNIIGADQMGARVGDLATLNPSYTQAQLSYLRRLSWKALKGAVEYAVLTGNNLITLPAGKIEIDIDDGDPIQIGDDQTAFLVGTSPETSVLDVFPKFNWAIGRQGTMFYLNQGGNIELRNLSVINHKNASGLQTYHVTLKPASVANRINIDPAASLWSGIWSNLSVGDTIAWSIAANVKSSSYDGLDVVATIDSVAKFITLVDTLPAEVTDDLSNVDTYIGIQWPEGTSDDTVSTYSKLWWNADTKMFVVETLETFDSSQITTLRMENCDFFHVGSILDASQTNLSVFGKNIRSVDSWQTTFTFFMQDNPDHPGKCFMDNLDLSLSGMLEDGGILGSASGPSAGNRWGSGFYFHPNIPLRIENSYIYNNETGAIREYSGVGASTKRPNSKSYSTFSNTVFEDNAEYSLLTSGVMPTHYNNVKFLGFGGVYVHYNSTFQGCEFDASVSLNSNNDPTTFAEERFYVAFEDCTFNEGANFDGTAWDIGELNRTTLSFQNCLFVIDSIAGTQKIDLSRSGVSPDSADILIKDCFYKAPDRFASLVYPNTPGQALQNFINPGSWHVVIDNLQPAGRKGEVFLDWFFSGLSLSNGIPPKIEIKNSTIQWRRLMNTNVTNTWHLPPLIEASNTKLHGGPSWQDIKMLSLPYKEGIASIDSVFFYGGTRYDKERWMEEAVYSDASNITLTPSPGGDKVVTTIWHKYPYTTNPNPTYNFGHANPFFYDTKTITPTDAITVLPFSATTASNIVLRDTLFMKPGYEYIFRGNPFQPLNIPDSLAIDTIQIATGDGSSTNIASVSGSSFANVFVPGTMQLITDDGVVCSVTPDGQVDCSAVKGYVRNWNGDHYLDFTTAPTLNAKIQLAGTVVKSPLFLGYWTLESTNDLATIPLVFGDNLGNHIMTQNLHTNGQWISNSGSSEGIYVTSGSPNRVGINTTFSPTSTLAILQAGTPNANTGIVQSNSTDNRNNFFAYNQAAAAIGNEAGIGFGSAAPNVAMVSRIMSEAIDTLTNVQTTALKFLTQSQGGWVPTERMRLRGDQLFIGEQDSIGIHARLVVEGKTNDGTTDIFRFQDSDAVQWFAMDTDGIGEMDGYLNGTGTAGAGLHFGGTNTILTTAGIRPTTGVETSGSGTNPWNIGYFNSARFGGSLWIDGTGLIPGNDANKGNVTYSNSSNGTSRWSIQSGNTGAFTSGVIDMQIRDTIRMLLDTTQFIVIGTTIDGSTNILSLRDRAGVEVFSVNTNGLTQLASHLYLPDAGQVRFDDGVGSFIREWSNGLEFWTGAGGTVRPLALLGSSMIVGNNSISVTIEAGSGGAIINGTTADGSTKIISGTDSGDAEVFTVNTDGETTIGSDFMTTDAALTVRGNSTDGTTKVVSYVDAAEVEQASMNTDGELLSKKDTEANTATSGAPNAIASSESGRFFTNEGATAENHHDLPAAVAGLFYGFIVQDADGMQINAFTGDTIRIGASVSGSGGLIETTTIGNIVILLAINDTEWIAISVVGTWTVT